MDILLAGIALLESTRLQSLPRGSCHSADIPLEGFDLESFLADKRVELQGRMQGFVNSAVRTESYQLN